MSFTYNTTPYFVLRLRKRSTPEKPLYLGEKAGSIVRDVFDARRHSSHKDLLEVVEATGSEEDFAIDSIFVEE